MQSQYEQVSNFSRYFQKIFTSQHSHLLPFFWILCKLDKDDYVFRSFWDREECCKILNAALTEFRNVGVIRYESIRSWTIVAEGSTNSNTNRTSWCCCGASTPPPVEPNATKYARKTPSQSPSATSSSAAAAIETTKPEDATHNNNNNPIATVTTKAPQ